MFLASITASIDFIGAGVGRAPAGCSPSARTLASGTIFITRPVVPERHGREAVHLQDRTGRSGRAPSVSSAGGLIRFTVARTRGSGMKVMPVAWPTASASTVMSTLRKVGGYALRRALAASARCATAIHSANRTSANCGIGPFHLLPRASGAWRLGSRPAAAAAPARPAARLRWRSRPRFRFSSCVAAIALDGDVRLGRAAQRVEHLVAARLVIQGRAVDGGDQVVGPQAELGEGLCRWGPGRTRMPRSLPSSNTGLALHDLVDQAGIVAHGLLHACHRGGQVRGGRHRGRQGRRRPGPRACGISSASMLPPRSSSTRST